MRAIKIFTIIGLFILSYSCEKNDSPDPSPINTPLSTGNVHLDSVLNNTPFEVPSIEETDALTLMREEEKMARDLYLNAYDSWSVNVFKNISNSEQKHMDAIKGLLMKYNIEDPVLNDGRGIFVNPVIDSIYLLLNQQQMLSKIEALKMGAFVEEFDINDLRVLKANVVDNVDITMIFDELERGSRNHLRSFVTNLSSQGVTYVPQVLSQTEFDAIINSPHEHGGGM